MAHQPTRSLTVPRAPDRLLSVTCVAEHLETSEKTVRRFVERGELRTHRIGNSIRISEDDLSLFINHRHR